MNRGELWDRLRSDGLVEGDLPERRDPAAAWYVRVMLGVAGWIGALFIMGFVAAAFAFVVKDEATAMIVGAACCTGAAFLFRIFDEKVFAEQFALVLSLAGQILMLTGLSQFLKPDTANFYFAAAGILAVLALAEPNFLHRVLTSAGAAAALALGIVQLSLHGFSAPILCAGLALIWLYPKRWARSGNVWRPIGYGLVLALLLIETFRLFGAQRLFGFAPETPSFLALYGPLIGRGLTALILAWAAAVLALREGYASASRTFVSAVAAALLVGLLSLEAPGLASALLILLLGFAAGNRLLMAMAIFSLLGFVAHFYYSLEATLLEKSGLLALTGVLLIAAWLVLRSGFPRGEEPAHA